jgi:nitrogen fixation protein NifQ
MNNAQLENAVCKFLQKYAVDIEACDEIAPYIAKKSLEINHLYEAMGFSSRAIMGKYMKQHFPELAKKKPNDVRWKKFLYDSIGAVAPACEGCPDSDDCFRAECSLEWHKKS